MGEQVLKNNLKVFVFFALFFVNIGMKGIFGAFSDETSLVWLNFILGLFGIIILMVTHKSSKTGIEDYGVIFLYLILVLYSFMSDNVGYGLQKAFLGLLLPYSIYKVLINYKWDEDQLVKYFTYAVHSLAIIALVYKIKSGFFNRAVNFGVLGPITFGWLCGMAYLLCLLKEKRNLINSLMIFYFFFLVLWTGSKGPLFGVLIISAFYYKKILGKKIITKVIVTFIILVGIFALIRFKDDVRALSAIVALLEDPEGYSTGLGSGSFGARIEYAKKSFDMIAQYPITGVGFGAWGIHSDGLHEYPHNIILELISETGVLVFLLFLLLVLSFKTKGVFRILGVYGMITLLFSGDFSYFRYTFFPLLLASYVYYSHNDILKYQNIN